MFVLGRCGVNNMILCSVGFKELVTAKNQQQIRAYETGPPQQCLYILGIVVAEVDGIAVAQRGKKRGLNGLPTTLRHF